jgi:hypothetical protein
MSRTTHSTSNLRHAAGENQLSQVRGSRMSTGADAQTYLYTYLLW